MKSGWPVDRFGRWPIIAVAALCFVALSSGAASGRESDDEGDDGGKIPLTVPKAVCGPEDHPETGLQGQVPAALRAAGFKGFNCNLELVGQSRGDGASWQFAAFTDQAEHTCFYHDTAFSTVNRTHLGVVVIDGSQPASPAPTSYLTTISFLDPWESLKVSTRRQIIAGVDAHNAGLLNDPTGTLGGGGPWFDVYDISGDCRQPQLLSSVPVGLTGASGIVATVVGHEGSFAPDGLTYYGSDLLNHQYYAIDVTNTTHPELIALVPTPYQTGAGTFTGLGSLNGSAHGLSLSDDGNRLYAVTLGSPSTVAEALDPNVPSEDGIVIYDVSDIQSRAPNPEARLISALTWRDGKAAQHTIPIKIRGKPYLIAVDELGTPGASNGWKQACDAGMSPFGMARIIDISEETEPRIVSKIKLESNNPANCSKVLPDLVGISGFTYDTHYCSVDNKDNATTLACANFEAGIRVYDIRNPRRPKEIAYFNPAAVTTPSPGSQNNRSAATGRPDHCSAQIHLDAATASLQTSCQDNGFLSLKFTNGVWPFEDSRTPPGEQN
jgi:hypothetical protein